MSYDDATSSKGLSFADFPGGSGDPLLKLPDVNVAASLEEGSRHVARTLSAAADLGAERLSSIVRQATGNVALVEKQFVAQSSQSLDDASKLQVAQVLKALGTGLQKAGVVFIDILNVIAEAATGKGLSELSTSAKAVGSGMVNSALDQIYQFITHNLGDMTVMQVMQKTAIVCATVLRTLWQILNIVISAVSGKSVGEWGLAANQYVQAEANTLMAKATASLSSVSEKTLSEVVTMTGSFLHDTTTLMAQGFEFVNQYYAEAQGAAIMTADAVANSATLALGF